ncbi:hypothetical protein L1049_025748 [Liquidambar formosana]|uniref:C3H1-type domain-containing protein n=1 Tax=Liquidambar formosana TaxID=63359 RepID=A0AAP0NDH4_LIQFO
MLFQLWLQLIIKMTIWVCIVVEEKKLIVHAAEEQIMINSDTAQCTIPLEVQTLDSDQRLGNTDMECDSYLLMKDNLPSVPNFLSLSTHGDGVSTTNFNDELMESVPDALSNMGSPETLSIVPGIDMLSSKLSLGQTSKKMASGDDKRLEEKPVAEVGSDLFACNLFSQNTKIHLNSEQAIESDRSFNSKAVPLLSQDIKSATHSLNPTSGESNERKNQLNYAVPRIFPGRSSFVITNSKKTTSSTHIANRRTWHRTGNPSASLQPGKKSFSSTVPPPRQSSRKTGKVQSTSYIRKGNSLVRKPATVAAPSQGSNGMSSSVYRLNPSGMDEMKSTGSDSRVNVTELPNLLRTGGTISAFDRPQTPPLPPSTTLPVCTVISPGECTPLPLAEPLLCGFSETSSDSTRFIENKDVPKSSRDALRFCGTSENQTGPIKSLESQSILKEGNLVSSSMKKIIYVKHKSNQLVAASNSRDSSVHNVDKTQVSSDRYYKRSKNQLIRTSLESHIKRQVAIADDSSNSEGQRALKVISSRGYSKRRSDKVVGTRKPSKFSLVWTLRDTQSSKKVGNPLQRQKVLPQLFPWKRATYWRSFMQNSAIIPNSLSTISRKLLLSRKRDTVYTRSTHGFSLRKSKVLSVGGSSLKWSKSIEKHSKKANEEATLAVAAAERKRREQNGAGCIISGAKTRNHSFRERIFRIGSVRYRMDSSKRTLQRISDDESSGPAALQEKNAKKSYVPRRLVIGNDEYVRIGNGNQLIRDPKKRVRILASEKVRWSLHTARHRLAKKRKYCQFYTRFGKCNKDDGKCPYIHDPSKIAVCTKFLNGLCSNPSCKLTHKVIPERMQDCFYFLQGEFCYLVLLFNIIVEMNPKF